MNIIFLDIDGVLNSIHNTINEYNKNHTSHSGYEYPFDNQCIYNLKELVEKTNSKLVITSTWRKDEIGIKRLLDVLRKYDLEKEVIGYTPVLNSNRGMEIKQYLMDNSFKEDVNFVILDDDKDMDDLLEYLVCTNRLYGLTSENINEAVKKLAK